MNIVFCLQVGDTWPPSTIVRGDIYFILVCKEPFKTRNGNKVLFSIPVIYSHLPSPWWPGEEPSEESIVLWASHTLSCPQEAWCSPPVSPTTCSYKSKARCDRNQLLWVPKRSALPPRQNAAAALAHFCGRMSSRCMQPARLFWYFWHL